MAERLNKPAPPLNGPLWARDRPSCRASAESLEDGQKGTRPHRDCCLALTRNCIALVATRKLNELCPADTFQHRLENLHSTSLDQGSLFVVGLYPWWHACLNIRAKMLPYACLRPYSNLALVHWFPILTKFCPSAQLTITIPTIHSSTTYRGGVNQNPDACSGIAFNPGLQFPLTKRKS